MARTALITARELIGYIESELQHHHEDARPKLAMNVLDIAMDCYFYGGSPQGYTKVEDALTKLGVESEPARTASEAINRNILGQIQKTLGLIYPARHYTHALRSNGDVVVTEYQLQTPEPFVGQIETAEEIAEGVDRWDWYPERMRRSMGVE